jgi:cytochrome c-type biogenesis protein
MSLELNLGIAFVAGLASFLSPCVFALVPAYISYLSGRSLDGQGPGRWETFRHGVAFVFGFSMVFVALGLTASLLGSLMWKISPLLTKIGGVVVVVFGLHMTGILRISFLEYDLRPRTSLQQQRSYLSSFLMGVFFSAGWSPCSGPVLGAILTLALNDAELLRGAVLLLAYSAGLAIPFLVSALGIGWVTQILRRFSKATHIVEVGMGFVLIVIGFMLFLGTFQQISRLLPTF